MFFTISYGIGLGCDSPVRRESFRSGSAWLGRFQKDGLPSRCRGWHGKLGFKAINSRTGKGQPDRCPFQSGPWAMDANTTHVLVLLAVLSLVCTALAWAVDHAVFSSVFAALAAVAFIGATPRPWR
jgi:hypothetical protein